MIVLPRQVRDKHRERTQKKNIVHAGPVRTFILVFVMLTVSLVVFNLSAAAHSTATSSEVRNTALFVRLNLKAIILPRQARDKHRKNSKKYRFPYRMLH
jgi:hypothetical protein